MGALTYYVRNGKVMCGGEAMSAKEIASMLTSQGDLICILEERLRVAEQIRDMHSEKRQEVKQFLWQTWARCTPINPESAREFMSKIAGYFESEDDDEALSTPPRAEAARDTSGMREAAGDWHGGEPYRAEEPAE